MTGDFEAGIGDAGERLDVFLSRCIPENTRSACARLCDQGRVTCLDKPLGKSHRVSPGERFAVDFMPPVADRAAAQEIPLCVVYEDSDLIVVDKPRGLVVHPACGHPDGTLVNALLHHCGGSLSGIGGVLRPGIVHRLDKNTSGLLLAAKNDAAHIALAAQLAARELHREYEALVRGSPRSESGIINQPVGRDPLNRKRMTVLTVHGEGGKEAITHYRVLDRYKEASLVECRLVTGRTHQIRAHMRWMGHPLMGDKLYGGPDNWGLDGQCLHAKQLSFTHPASGKQMTFTAIKPPYFNDVLAALHPL